MGFSTVQLRDLRRDLSNEYVRTRESNGRDLRYIEGWKAISEANRIFGFDGWDRETLETRCVLSREIRGSYIAVYIAKVRITVRVKGTKIVREGHGCGEGRGSTPAEIHDMAVKAAETDATKRALVTFGKPFGLALAARALPPNDVPSQTPITSIPTKRSEENPVSGQSRAEDVPLPPDAIDNHGRDHNVDPNNRIDKSVLTFGEPRRVRNKAHLRFVARQPCLVCGRTPSDAHHVRFAQSPALGRKVSDEFTVPLCRSHHRDLHHSGKEANWWSKLNIDPVEIARSLWLESNAKQYVLVTDRLSGVPQTESEGR